MNALNVKLFMDGAEVSHMKEAAQNNPLVKGFTTNPTLMRKAGVQNYTEFAKEACTAVKGLPISFEVFSDDMEAMEQEARIIASWGPNVNVKIPISNTKGESCCPLIGRLAREGIVVNVTAILTLEQVEDVAKVLHPETGAIISIFAGRIADTGRDPIPYMKKSLELMKQYPKAEVLWASPREVLNIYQAHEIGCHIITATHDLIAKLPLMNKNLGEYSLETVKMFYNDAQKSGFSL